MTGSISITRRLIITVLLLELSSAIALIGAITVHERQVQLKAFEASLFVTTESLMGAVQDAEDESDNVMLDLRGVRIARDSVFRIEDERGRVLGSAGDAPRLEMPASGAPAFRDANVNGRRYRFLIFKGLRIVDPDEPKGGVRHDITIVCGAPVGHVWHEVFEAIRFFAIATAILLGITAMAMVWLVRKGLSPVHELAREAARIHSNHWHFDAPMSAKQTAELRPLADALEAALVRVRRSFEQQRRFTNDAAHELKTDVAILKSSLQLLSMRKRSVEEYGKGLALSMDDVTRLESAVQRMLTLARLETPKQSESVGAKPQYCSLHNAVEEAMNQSMPLAELKGIEVIFDFTADASVPIESRDALLLCSNILLNAVQHSPNQGTVRIALTVDEHTAQLTVQDQGEGISERDRAYVFEPFYRTDPSRSRKSGGTGLGLSICKAICERAGGSIEIANETAGGALVLVKLPAEPVRSGSKSSGSLKAQRG
ncbi:MAG: HAMP domain-containing sensor histidine kinase [Candidatus Sulfotelmatobacter sp.]